MAIREGDIAPALTLFADDKSEVSLKDLRGQPVVILFFSLAFTGACTDELCYVRDHVQDYNRLDAKVLGISVDTVFSLARYKEEYGLNFNLLSDFNKEVSRAYGVLWETFVMNMRGVASRSAFVVDGEGVVVHAQISESFDGVPDMKQIELALESLNA